MSKKISRLIFLVSLSFTLVACNNTPQSTTNNGSTHNSTPKQNTQIPDVSELVENEPINAMPDVGDVQLRGNATTAGATAVITLQRTTASFTGTNVNVTQNPTYGTIVEITSSGTYVIQGTLEQGFVAISKKDLDVTIVLNGVNIYCKNYAAIACLKKSNVTIELADGSTNYLTDGGQGAADGKYQYGYDDEEQPNATICVRKDLIIKGYGKLIVNGNLNNGIGSRANLTIYGGDIYVSAINNALKGNDSITISGGSFTLTSQQDGIKSEETGDGLGTITITGGSFAISSVQDAIQAAANLIISNANIKIKTGGGSSAKTTPSSAKGLKAAESLVINSGIFDIDSNDDGIHSNNTITINGGTIAISSGDDGIHADNRIIINSGTISISKCYEGIESQNIDINGGNITIKSSDDGINISGGKDSSGLTQNRPMPGRPGGFGGGGNFTPIDGTLTITSGEIYINSIGDGIDSNGNIAISGGTIIIMGPERDPDVPFDYDGTCTMIGGTLIALGSAGQMVQQPGTSSAQCSFIAKFTTAVAAGSVITVESNAGVEIVNITTLVSAKGLIVCSPLLKTGTTYKISANGSVLKTVTINSTINTF